MPDHQQIQQSKKPDTIFQKQATPVIHTPVSNPYSIIQRAKINPRSLTRADIMQLQRTIGNQAVGRLLSSIGNTSTDQQATVQRQEIPEEEEPLQGKMIQTIQRQEIPDEEEPLQGKFENKPENACSSCFAATIVQRQEIPEEEEPLQGKMVGTIQRQEIPEEEEPLQGKFENKPEISCPSCFAAPIVQKQELEEEEPLQGKFENKPEIACPSCFAASIVQRQEIPEEEEPLQGKMIETIQRQEIPEEEEPLQTKMENNTGMPDNLKAGVENLSGIDISDVRVHYNSDKPAEVGALAYTQGADIHVAPGQERHLPHEAWHVVQQAQGRVKPTMQLKGLAVNDDTGLEKEADVMGRKAVQPSIRQQLVSSVPSFFSSNIPIQRDVTGTDPAASFDGGANPNDLFYGQAEFRGVTLGRLSPGVPNFNTKRRTIDEYNEDIGINASMAVWNSLFGIFEVRQALKDPNPVINWATHLRADQNTINIDEGLKLWINLLVRNSDKIGLYDLGDTKRSWWFFGEKRGLKKIKEKNRYTKNIRDPHKIGIHDYSPTFTPELIHSWLNPENKFTEVKCPYLKDNDSKQLSDWIHVEFFRRTSKLGIDFTTSFLNAKIHFNTAAEVGHGVDREGIQHLSANPNGHRKITVSEYKHAQKLIRNGLPRGKINFYSEFA